MAVEVARFLENVRLTKAPKTYGGYKYDLGLFQQSCRKRFLEDIKEADIKDFIVFLRKRNLGDRTVFNTLEAVHKFLRENGIAGMPRKSWPGTPRRRCKPTTRKTSRLCSMPRSRTRP